MISLSTGGGPELAALDVSAKRDRFGSLPERHDLVIRLIGRVHQPDPGLAAGRARVLLLVFRHRGTSETTVSSIRSGGANLTGLSGESPTGST
jgi:hypothetical protein